MTETAMTDEMMRHELSMVGLSLASLGQEDAAKAVSYALNRIASLEAALESIAVGSKRGQEMFKERMGDRKSLTWFAVNVLQDNLAACEGSARAALATTQKGLAK